MKTILSKAFMLATLLVSTTSFADASFPKYINGINKNNLCKFPFSFKFTAKQDAKMIQGSPTIYYDGPWQYTLSNLDTGKQYSDSGVGQSIFTPHKKTIAFNGATLFFVPNFFGNLGLKYPIKYPIVKHTGLMTLNYANNSYIEDGKTELLNPCQLLDPNYQAPVPRTTPAPWPVLETDPIGAIKLAKLDIPLFAYVLHLHTHLDIFVNGQRVLIPAGIGMVEPVAGIGNGFYTDSAFYADAELHTHWNDGVIHIETTSPSTFTLGQFFDVWQVRLNKQCLGSYCDQGNQKLEFYINGKLYTGDPRAITLDPYSEIAIIYGKQPREGIPSCFYWDSNPRLKKLEGCVLPTALPPANLKPIFSVSDPVGDDDGPGNYVYPAANRLPKGALDLTGFKVYVTPDKQTAYFQVQLANLNYPYYGSEMGGALIDIYVHDPKAAAADTSTDAISPLRNYKIANDYAWSREIELTGVDGKMLLLHDAHSVILNSSKPAIDPTTGIISFALPTALLGGVPDKGWGFIVVVTAEDGLQPDDAMAFDSMPTPNSLGVCSATTPMTDKRRCLFNPNNVPNVMDIITNESQKDMLDYTVHNPVVLRGVLIP